MATSIIRNPMADSVLALRTWAEFTTETEIDTPSFAGYKELYVEISWYSSIVACQSVTIPAWKRGFPFLVVAGNYSATIKYLSDTKISILTSPANVRCNVFAVK